MSDDLTWYYGPGWAAVQRSSLGSQLERLAATGGSRSCPRCGGEGILSDGEWCPRCGGTGSVAVPLPRGGEVTARPTCPTVHTGSAVEPALHVRWSRISRVVRLLTAREQEVLEIAHGPAATACPADPAVLVALGTRAGRGATVEPDALELARRELADALTAYHAIGGV